MSYSDSIQALIKKYGIILIVFYLFNQFLAGPLSNWIAGLMDESTGVALYKYSLTLSISLILVSLILAFITLSDTQNDKLRWLIFFVTAVVPTAGIVFLIIWKMNQLIQEKGLIAESGKGPEELQ